MDGLKNLLVYICMFTGFPFAWLYVKLFSSRPRHGGFLENLGTVVLAIWIGVFIWIVVFIGLAGFGIYKAICG